MMSASTGNPITRTAAARTRKATSERMGASSADKDTPTPVKPSGVPTSSVPLTTDESPYTRLHISPLTANLLPTILPADVLPLARAISYHELSTFPERAYGFVELPHEAAERVKKKMHGSILRGAKVRVEKARRRKPEPEQDGGGGGAEEETVQSKPAGGKKTKGKKEDKKGSMMLEQTIPGVEIGDRQVKRGWTVPTASGANKLENRRERKIKDKERKRKEADASEGLDNRGTDRRKSHEKKKTPAKSKYTTEPECLFKTILPANVAAQNSLESTTSEAPSTCPKKRKRGLEREITVHEFQQTTKHATFLKDSTNTGGGAPRASSYVDGKGWVDAGGNIVEPERKSKRPSIHKEPAARAVAPTVPNIDEEDATSTSDSSSSDSEDTDESEDVKMAIPAIDATRPGMSRDEATDSSTLETPKSQKSTQLPSETTPSMKGTPKLALTITIDSPTQRRPGSSDPSTALSITIPEAGTSLVHPLEALYKKAKPRGAEHDATGTTDEPFSFFAADDDPTASMPPPMTPYTEKDFQWRQSRSAAPTPDTAFANKRFEWPRVPGSRSEDVGHIDEEEEEDDDDDEQEQMEENNMDPGTGDGQAHASHSDQSGPTTRISEQSEFAKWFYEHRGETTRAWKQRRRTVAKEKRQRENRKRDG